MGWGLNIGDHWAFVQEASVGPDAVRLTLAAAVAPDDWIPGGDAYYVVDLKRDAQGRLDGTWTGTFRDVKLEGRAYGQVRPPRPIRVKDFVPLAPGEHPRLLFRKYELAALKEKLKTPLGEAYLAKAKAHAAAGDPVSTAMLYQLTGDPSYARAAQTIIGGYGDLAPEGGAGTGGVGHRFVAVTLTADLCWDAWPEGFKRGLEQQMLIDLTVIQRRLQIAGANFNPCSNFYGPARGSAAIATLLFYGDPGPEPRRPVAPDEMVAKGDFTAKLLAKTGRVEAYRAEYPKLLARWQTEYDEWKAGGGADLEKVELFQKGVLHMYRHYRVGVGDGGFAAETGAYAGIASRYPLYYAAYYLRCFGRNPSPYPDVTHILSRRMMQCVFPEAEAPRGRDTRFRERQPVELKVNSVTGFWPEWVAAAFNLAPDEHKPSLLWGWNYVRRVREDDPASVANVLPDEGTYGTYLANAFVNYPLDMKPVHPRDGMPRAWQAPTMGLYVFRSGWEGRDDCVGQVFAKAHRIGGWNHPNAGTLNLYGLGHAWATCNPDRLGFRDQENVVLLPEDSINMGACGYVSHVRAGPDGSGDLTIDLRDLLGGAKTVPLAVVKGPTMKAGGVAEIDPDAPTERTLPVRDMLNRRLPENWVDTGLSGLRAVAFDYSGASGAPCLMAIVDRIAGGKKRLWCWHVTRDSSKMKAGPVPEVRIEGNTFALVHGDATLRATFVAPKGVTIEHKKQDVLFRGARVFEGFFDRVEATGGDNFFVIITLQRKDAPPVKVEGEGLAAVATVGGRTVRFDGEKIVLGPPAQP
jgi:hypothetical protein